jgi:Helix-turn-helix.
MHKEELKKLGQLIRAKRESQKLTQYELANKSNVDKNYVGMLERGERNPSYLSLLKIANGIGIPVNKLIEP